MYTSRSSLPFGIKPAGLGAAFIVNGALLTALYLYIGPNIVAAIKETVTVGRMIEDPPVPPPEDQPKPVEKQVARENTIVAPDPVIKTEPSENTVTTTTKIEDRPQAIDPGKPEGDALVTRDPPEPPLPPLIGAQLDTRYASNFQPEYPSSEIRLNRDGKVAVRVLIGADGRVKAVERVSATSDAFFESTRRQAMNKWRFKPATRGGTPQESWKVINVRFTMTDQ